MTIWSAWIWIWSTAQIIRIRNKDSSIRNEYRYFLNPDPGFLMNPDTDPHTHLNLAVLWIQIRIRIGPRRAQKAKGNSKQLKNFIFWSAGCSLLRAERFSCRLDVLYEGLTISKLQFFIKKLYYLYPDLQH